MHTESGLAGAGEVGAAEFDQAILRTVAGVERKNAVLSADEKGVIARHEAGHAAVSTAVLRVLPRRASPVEKLSIVPRSGGALGCASPLGFAAFPAISSKHCQTGVPSAPC